MFAGLVENLGLKEGLQEFKEQFRQDAKATIAETEWAQDRGIDVAKLDALEQKLHHHGAELHDRTIGRAVETLAQDETIAQLLDLTAAKEAEEDYEEVDEEYEEEVVEEVVAEDDAEVEAEFPGHADLAAGVQHTELELAAGELAAEPQQELTALAAEPVVAQPAAAEQDGAAAASGDEVRSPSPDSAPDSACSFEVTQARAQQPDCNEDGAVAASSSTAPAFAPSPRGPVLNDASSPEPAAAATPGLRLGPQPASSTPAPPKAGNNTAAAQLRTSERSEKLRRLELDIREKQAAKAAVEAELRAVREQSSGLESRWKEIAAVSQDAAKNSTEAREQIDSLRATLAETDTKLAEAMDIREHLESEVARHTFQHKGLESAFQEKLEREVSQKEQELLDEVTYLRRSQGAKEKKLQEMQVDLDRLARRCGGISAPGQGKMVAPHIALQTAFGYDDSDEHPCIVLFDGPCVKMSRCLLRGTCLRRFFFIATAVFWLVALQSALKPQHGGHIIHT